MTATAVRPRLSASRRPWLVAAALVPAIGVQTAAFGWRVPSLAAVAAVAALGGDALGRRLRGQPAMAAATHGDAVPSALVFALCLSAPILATPDILAAGVAALVLACAGRDARRPAFPPAMAALALLALAPWAAADVATPMPADFVLFTPERALALAYVAAGLVLASARVLRLPASLSALAGAGLALLAAPAFGQSSEVSPSTLMLLAFVLVVDPSLACAGRRARVLAGLLLGMLTVALPGASGPLGALPFAALLVAACTPWLDGLADPPRAAGEPLT